MTALLVAVAAAVAALAVWAILAREQLAERLRPRSRTLEPGPKRILFPFVGTALSRTALDAALRLCRAEGATLVPAYLAQVPMTLPLNSSLPRQARQPLPILDAIEQRAFGAEVPVDSRIERGRTYRHALLELIGHEDYDRIVTAAATNGKDGFSADDVAWLLEHAPGEIVVLRPWPATSSAEAPREQETERSS